MPFPPYLLNIFTHTVEGEPMETPTWGLLGDEEIDFLALSCEGTIILGEHETGHYLVDPADIGLDYATCKAYRTAQDQYATLTAETDQYTLSADDATCRFHLAQMAVQKAIRTTSFLLIDTAAFKITDAHKARRYVML